MDEENDQKRNLKMDSKMKLIRFCYLGSFAPVYVHLHGYIKVAEYWPIVKTLIEAVNAQEFISFLTAILTNESLVRRDEVLFIYAAFMASSVEFKWKTDARKMLPNFVHDEDDFFLFCKYTMLISTEERRKCLSRTVRKTIAFWYQERTAEELRKMWMSHRGLHGLTHRALMKYCHIPDETIGSSEVAKYFFKTCTDLLKEEESKDELLTQAQSTRGPEKSLTSRRNPKKPLIPISAIMAISKLRTTKIRQDAIKIIRTHNLQYYQVPGHWLRFFAIMEAVIPTMPYLQILKSWRKMVRYNHFENSRTIFKTCKKELENNVKAKESRVYPIHILMGIRGIGKKELNVSPTKINCLKLDYLEKLYMESFDWPAEPANVRMHITLNLQTNYKKKMLKNHKNLSYYDACLALSFGYCKREKHVDVFHWCEQKSVLKRIPFEKDFTTELGFSSYHVVENNRNNQLLATPIDNALCSEQVYDVFLCIVPTAGRGNPHKNSDYLCSRLKEYRKTKNNNAKFIILNLLKFKGSMKYSKTDVENILEICGLDDHTTDIIKNFGTHRFD